jgi:hypothetical protein
MTDWAASNAVCYVLVAKVISGHDLERKNGLRYKKVLVQEQHPWGLLDILAWHR